MEAAILLIVAAIFTFITGILGVAHMWLVYDLWPVSWGWWWALMGLSAFLAAIGAAIKDK